MSKLIEDVYVKAGGRKRLCLALTVSNQTLSDWMRTGAIPAKHAVAVEGMTKIDREVLCPSFDWGRPTPAKHPGRRAGDRKAA